MRIRFAKNAESANGSTRLFRFRVVDPDGRSLGMGSCTIPDTDLAEELTLRALNIARRPVKAVSAPEGPRFSSGCVTSGTCMLEGIVITAPGTSWGYNGGYAWGPTGAGGGGGDGFDASAGVGQDEWSEDPGPDGSFRPECERSVSGFCVTRPPSDEEWTLLGQRINSLRTHTVECAAVKQILQNLYAQGIDGGRIIFWDGYDIYWDAAREKWRQRTGQNLSDIQGRYLEYDAHWVLLDPSVLVHEALHYYLNEINSPLYGEANEDWVLAREDTCH